MSNKKVYLAKHTLASGFDVEYVKSHLSRIPGIVIIESGSDIDPEECEAFVIVPHKQCKHDKGHEISLSKNVFEELDSFLGNYQGEEDDSINCVYIFSKSSNSLDSSSDVEKTMPRAYYPTEDCMIDTYDIDSYDKYGYLTVNMIDEEEGERDDTSLLWNVSEHIDVAPRAYCQVPRHFTPKPEYAVPAVPSLEERKIKQNVFPVDLIQKQLDFISKDRRRLLLLRRK